MQHTRYSGLGSYEDLRSEMNTTVGTILEKMAQRYKISEQGRSGENLYWTIK